MEKENQITKRNKAIPVPISNVTFNRILKLKNNESVLLLYMAYCDIAVWYETAQIWATTGFMCKRLKMNERKFLKAKKALLELGLIRDVRKRNDKNTGFGKCFIKVNFMFKADQSIQDTVQQNENVVPQNEWGTSIQDKYLKQTNNKSNKLQTDSLNINNCAHERTVRKRKVIGATNNEEILLAKIKELENQIKELQPVKAPLPINEPKQLNLFPKEELITEKHFAPFWEMFPNKIDKGTAHTAWTKLCSQKNKQSIRPTWKVLQTALKGHIKSERWQDPTFRIPNPATWINGERWLNDGRDMKKLTFDNNFNKPKNGNGKVYTGAMGSKIEYRIDQYI
jgi:hypothetical protein